jgi:hypothetical protein
MVANAGAEMKNKIMQKYPIPLEQATNPYLLMVLGESQHFNNLT